MRIPAYELGFANIFRRQIESLETSSQDAQMILKLVGNLQNLKADGNDECNGDELDVLGITVFGDESGELIPRGWLRGECKGEVFLELDAGLISRELVHSLCISEHGVCRSRRTW